MTDITRRQFLKGLCAAAGLAAIPDLPYLEAPVADAKGVNVGGWFHADMSQVPHAVLQIGKWQLPMWQAAIEEYLQPLTAETKLDDLVLYAIGSISWKMMFDLHSAPMDIIALPAYRNLDFMCWPPLCEYTFAGTANHADIKIGNSVEFMDPDILGHGDVINVTLYGDGPLNAIEAPMMSYNYEPIVTK